MPPHKDHRENLARRDPEPAKPGPVQAAPPATATPPVLPWDGEGLSRLARLISRGKDLTAERLANHAEADRLNGRNAEITQELRRIRLEVEAGFWGGQVPA